MQIPREKSEALLPASGNVEPQVKQKLDELQLWQVQGALPLLGTVVGNDVGGEQQG